MPYPIKRHPLALTIAALITSNPALAADLSNETSNTEGSIEEISVWGTQIKASSLDLGEDAIAIRQADHLSDLLRFIPGVDVGGAHSLNQRVTIRSLDDKDLRVTIDGAIQNTYMFHHMGNLQIHSDILRAADIDVGNNSVINGGLIGVARFETRSAKDMLRTDSNWEARLNTTYASNASVRASATVYGLVTSNIDILAYVNGVDRGNYRVGGGDIKDADGNVIPGTDGKVRGLEGELIDALVKVGVDITANQRIKLGYEVYQDKGDYSARPDMGLATDLAIGNGESQLHPTIFTRDTLTLNYDADLHGVIIEAVAFGNISTLERNELGLGRDPNIHVQEGEATNTGVDVLIEHTLGSSPLHTLTYGIEAVSYETEYTAHDKIRSVIRYGDEKAQSAAAFIEDRIDWGNFAVTPGARFNRWDIDGHLIDKTYSEPTFALALDYTIHRDTIIKASATELFKGPELSEVFTGAGTGDVYNADIKAETGTNTEFGISHHGKVFNTGVTGFETVINDYIYDYIQYTLSSAPYPKDNIGDLRLSGIETFWGFTLSNLDVLLTYASIKSNLHAYSPYITMPYDDGETVVFQEGFDGARTDRTQGNTYTLLLDYYIPGWGLQFHYDFTHVSSMPAGKDLDGATLNNSKDGYNLHNVSVQWAPRIAEGLTLTGGIDNLADEYYASQASRTGVSFHPRFGKLYLTDYEPGRNIKASIAYQF